MIVIILFLRLTCHWKIDLYKNDVNLFSQLFLQAEKENEEAINIINRCFYHKNLNNKFISILETLSISNIKYAQNFLYDYYLNFLNDRGLAGLFIKQLFDSNIILNGTTNTSCH